MHKAVHCLCRAKWGQFIWVINFQRRVVKILIHWKSHKEYTEGVDIVNDATAGLGKLVANCMWKKSLTACRVRCRPNGSLMVNMRHQSSKTVGRAVAVSDDDGITWGNIVFDKQLVSPVRCCGGRGRLATLVSIAQYHYDLQV